MFIVIFIWDDLKVLNTVKGLVTSPLKWNTSSSLLGKHYLLQVFQDRAKNKGEMYPQRQRWIIQAWFWPGQRGQALCSLQGDAIPSLSTDLQPAWLLLCQAAEEGPTTTESQNVLRWKGTTRIIDSSSWTRLWVFCIVMGWAWSEAKQCNVLNVWFSSFFSCNLLLWV